MWELDYKENWVQKNWCFWTVVLEKTLQSPLDGKEIQPVHPKGDQSWVFIGRTDAEAETLVLWPPDVKSWLIWKDPDARKDWRWEEKGTTEDVDGWMASPTRLNLSLSKLWGLVMDREAWHAAVHRVTKTFDMTEQLKWWSEVVSDIIVDFTFHTLMERVEFYSLLLFYLQEVSPYFHKMGWAIVTMKEEKEVQIVLRFRIF